MPRNQEKVTRLALYGVAPFVFTAAVMWLAPFLVPQWVALNLHSLILAYAGILAAFIAGVGMNASGQFAASIIAALLCWFAIWPSGFLTFSISPVWRYFLLIGVFLWLMARDLGAAAQNNYPRWYGPLRIRITVWICVALVIIASRLITWGYY
ncbi:MAG: DUF3429 family protein [Parvularculaceae bacterium]